MSEVVTGGYSDPIFGPLWRKFATIPGLEWEAYKERVRLIIEHVFHFCILPDCVDVHGLLAIPEAINGKPLTLPLAYYDSINERWMLRDDRQETITFDPLRNMDDAMQIVEELYEKSSMDMHMEMDHDRVHRYRVYGYSIRGGELLGGGHGSDNSMNEAICVAALRISGIEVVV